MVLDRLKYFLLICGLALAGCGGGGGGSEEEVVDNSEGTGPIRCIIKYHEQWVTWTGRLGTNWTWVDETAIYDGGVYEHIDTSGCSWKNIYSFMEGRAKDSRVVKNTLFYNSLEYPSGDGLFHKFPSEGPLSWSNIPGYDPRDWDWRTSSTPDANTVNCAAQAAVCEASFEEIKTFLDMPPLSLSNSLPGSSNYKMKTEKHRPENLIMQFPIYGWERQASRLIGTRTFNFPYLQYELLTPEVDMSFSWDIKEETRHKWLRRIDTITVEVPDDLVNYYDYLIMSCNGDGVYGSVEISSDRRKAVFTWTYDDDAGIEEIRPVDDPAQQLVFQLNNGGTFTVNLAGSIPAY